MSAFYNISTDEIVDIDPLVFAQWQTEGNPKALRYAVVPELPTYDPNTQKAPIFQGGTWVVIDKTVEELEAEAEKSATEQETRQIKLIISAIKSGNGTNAERIARLERVVAHIVKHLFFNT